MFMDFPGDSDAKESAFNLGDLGLENPLEKELQYSCRENSMDREFSVYSPWGCKQTQLSNFHFHLHMFICCYCFIFKIFT